MSLLTGTLPAQYGLRTAGVLDITSRSFAAPGGDISLYGGSWQAMTPSFDYGGSVGNGEYFVSSRGNWNDLGIENPTPAVNAIHDATQQGKFFGYASTLLDESDAPFRDLDGVLQRAPDTEQSRPDAARRFRLAERQFGNAQRKRIRHLHRQYRGLAAARQRRRCPIRRVFALCRSPFRSRYHRRPRIQRCRLGRDPAKHAQRRAVRCVLYRQRSPHLARRLHRERRADQYQQHLHGPARIARGGDRTTFHHHRQRLQARLEYRHLHSGRMEVDAAAYA